MTGALDTLLARFRGRPDSEHVQATVRLATLGLVLLGLVVVVPHIDPGEAALRELLFLVALGTSIALGLLVWIAVRPGVSHVRRVIGMLTDYGLIGIAMHLVGEGLAPLYVVLMWVTVGTGLRFGNRYLLAAAAMASATFLAVILGTPFWQGIPVLAFGLLAGLGALPLYVGRLLGAGLEPTWRETPVEVQGPAPSMPAPMHRVSNAIRLAERDRGALPAPPVPGVVRGTGKVIAFDDPFVRHRARVAPMRVLVADDQAASVLVLQRILEKAGHRMVAVAEGDDVLDQIEDNTYDAVIIDLHMPGLGGLDVLKQARVIESGRQRTPFIVLAVDAMDGPVAACENAGAFAVLSKPVQVPRLLDVLAGIGAVGRGDSQAVSARSVDEEDLIQPAILEELAELNLGDDFIERFVDECTRDARRCIAAMEHGASTANWDEYREQCHALKGVASNMGAARLAAHASAALDASDWQLHKTWQGSVADFRRELELARGALRRPRKPGAREEDPERG